MDCNACRKAREDADMLKDVYLDRANKRINKLTAALVITVTLLVASNIVWIQYLL